MRKLYLVVLATSFLCGTGIRALAVPINPEIANMSYWYDDQNIRDVITDRLGNNVYIAPAAHNVSELINDVAKAAILEAQSGKPALIPVNLGNNHWTALAIRKITDGKLIVFYNDSFGSNVGGENSESGKYLAAIREIVADAEIIDLQVRQQNDGSSCGAFTAENLIALAELADEQLNAADAKAVLEKIKDAQAIRLLHLNSLNSLYEKIVTKEEAANNVVIKNNIEVISSSVLHEISYFKNVTADRLGQLYLTSNVNGFNSGDELAVYGVWVHGALGSGVYKAKDSRVFKNKTSSIILGAESKIDDDTTLGVAGSFGQSNLKLKIPSNDYINTNLKSFIGSLYGSFIADEKIVINGSISFGKLVGKTDYQSILTGKNSFKLKGNSFGANIEASYYVPVGSVTLIPSLGSDYAEVKFAKAKLGSITINKFNIKKLSIDPTIRLLQVFEASSMSLIPELSARASYALFSRASNIIIKNANGVVLSDSPQKAARNSYNFGANLTLAGDMLETTIGFERFIQNKYLGHVGYMKLRINI